MKFQEVFGFEKPMRKRKINPLKNVWVAAYGATRTEDGWEWYEKEFPREPTAKEIRELEIAQINAETDEKILRGFVWRGMPVWLSTENQFNYKAAYDLAVQTEGASLPVKFKFGTDEEPQYHTFETLDELTDFYVSAIGFVNATLEAGWQAKDSIDWSEFEG